MKNKPTVMTYNLKMSNEDGQKGIKCYGLKISMIDKIIITFSDEDEDNFYFESDVECYFKDKRSGTIIDTHNLFSKYILLKNKEIKNCNLTPGTLYKITYNKIEKYD